MRANDKCSQTLSGFAFVFIIINSRIFALKQRPGLAWPQPCIWQDSESKRERESEKESMCNNNDSHQPLLLLTHSLAETPLFALAGCGFPTLAHTCTCKLSLTRRRCIIAWRARVPVVLVLPRRRRRRVVSCLNMQSIVVAVCSLLCCCCWQCKTLHCTKIELCRRLIGIMI